jgi:hypothetical protein
MKKVKCTRRSKAINALLEQADAEDIIVESADGRQFLLTALDDFEREIEATRRNEKLMQLLEERAKQTELVPLDEARQRLGLSDKDE